MVNLIGQKFKILNRNASGNQEIFEGIAVIKEIHIDNWDDRGEAYCTVQFDERYEPESLYRWVYLDKQ